MKIELKILDHAKDMYREFGLPRYATSGSGAIDLMAAEDAVIGAGDCLLIKTGMAFHIKDPGVLGVLNARSGLGHKEGLVLGNCQGWIDSDYTQEILISAWNRNRAEKDIHVKAGDRIAQITFIPIMRVDWDLVDDFSDPTQRGGFGSTSVWIKNL